MSCAPARTFRLAGGTLRRGAPADVTVFDPNATWVVDPSRFKSKGRNTPYAGQTLQGRVRQTVVGGRVVYRAEA
jgi:dihydroorotase